MEEGLLIGLCKVTKSPKSEKTQILHTTATGCQPANVKSGLYATLPTHLRRFSTHNKIN